MKNCSIKNCYQKYKCKGFCSKHYQRLHVYKKDPAIATRFDTRKAIIKDNKAYLAIGINAKDGYAIVDKQYAWIEKYKWSLTDKRYAHTCIENNVKILLHHMIVGKPPEGLVTDHVNRNKLDNRVLNLRFVTQKENLANRITTPVE